MEYRWEIPARLVGREVDDHLDNRREQLEFLDDLIGPDEREIEAYLRVARVESRHSRHGYPEGGGWRSQPAWYLHHLDLARDARAMADAAAREEDEVYRRNQKSDTGVQ